MQFKLNRRKAVSEIANEILHSLGIQISPQTMGNRLYAQDFHGRIARRNQYINRKNRIKGKSGLRRCYQSRLISGNASYLLMRVDSICSGQMELSGPGELVQMNSRNNA